MWVIPKLLYKKYIESEKESPVKGYKSSDITNRIPCCNKPYDAPSANVVSVDVASTDAASADEVQPLCTFIRWSFISFVVFPCFKLTWEAIDVLLDMWLFYRLEKGDKNVMSTMIYRDAYINNAIMAFAILGALNMLLCVRMTTRKVKRDGFDLDEMDITLATSFMFVYLFEDGPEFYLEYFFVEKYLLERPQDNFLIAKDALVAVMVLKAIMKGAKDMWKKCQNDESFCVVFWFFGTALLIGIASVTRVGAVLYQYNTGNLNSACLSVAGGRLIQHPFASGCLRGVESMMLILIFIPMIPSFLAFCCFAFK